MRETRVEASVGEIRRRQKPTTRGQGKYKEIDVREDKERWVIRVQRDWSLRLLIGTRCRTDRSRAARGHVLTWDRDQELMVWEAKASEMVASDVLPRGGLEGYGRSGRLARGCDGWDADANRATGPWRRRAGRRRGDARWEEAAGVVEGFWAARMRIGNRNVQADWGRHRHLEEEEMWWWW